MKRIAAVVLLLALLGVAACGDEEPERTAEVPSWAKVAPEQIAEAKKHGVPVAFENDLGMRFVLIPAGTFLMGSPEDEEGRGDDETQHEVTITKPFYMATTEVTNAQYRRFRPNHSSHKWSDSDAQGAHGFTLDRDDQPVAIVSWADAVAFAAWRSEADGRRVYRLPTEAEWEYACRAGTKTAFAFGETLRHDQAAFHPGYEQRTQRCTGPVDVAGFTSNTWGLHEMHGNVWEWCLDEFEEGPGSEAAVDPSAQTWERCRIVRGGSWGNILSAARSSSRTFFGSDGRSLTFGFRLVSPLPEPSK